MFGMKTDEKKADHKAAYDRVYGIIEEIKAAHKKAEALGIGETMAFLMMYEVEHRTFFHTISTRLDREMEERTKQKESLTK